MNRDRSLELKQIQFNSSMEIYEKKIFFRLFGKLVSIVNVSLQAFLLYRVIQISIGPFLQAAALISAYLFADFINGLVHMYMDNNDRYDSIAGPFIASFHLHHRTPQYKVNNLLLVYFNESGSKIWLVGYLLSVTALIVLLDINPVASCILVYTGILSSVAEVSHYLCHIPGSNKSRHLAKFGLLLSKRHHGRHHVEDNVSYAFLNGFTDPLLDLIAGKFYPGYKNTTDRHYLLYTGKGTGNRE